ncbi:MAG: hypothetical protein M0T73_14970 [Deltaproteobacteria bacterium]|nr:hypothetical protein [Deltaproteobacteria bacterium]
MILSPAIELEPTHERKKLQTLTRQELQTLTVSKYNFDQDFPEHSKLIENSEFWRIARRKTFDKLCSPSGANEAENISCPAVDFSLRSK